MKSQDWTAHGQLWHHLRVWDALTRPAVVWIWNANVWPAVESEAWRQRDATHGPFCLRRKFSPHWMAILSKNETHPRGLGDFDVWDIVTHAEDVRSGRCCAAVPDSLTRRRNLSDRTGRGQSDTDMDPWELLRFKHLIFGSFYLGLRAEQGSAFRWDGHRLADTDIKYRCTCKIIPKALFKWMLMLSHNTSPANL